MEEELQDRLVAKYRSRAITTQYHRVMETEESLVQRYAESERFTSKNQYDFVDTGDLRSTNSVSA
jgi:hypothetical protein